MHRAKMNMKAKNTIYVAVLAAGNSVRFGENKLLFEFEGQPLFSHVLKQLNQADIHICVVTQYEQIAEYCRSEEIPYVLSPQSRAGISYSIKAAVNYFRELGAEDLVFTAADQPYLKAETVRTLTAARRDSGKGLGSLMTDGHPSNPTIFGCQYFDELLTLEGDAGGRKIIKRHQDDCVLVEGDSRELSDIDFKSQVADSQ